MFSFKEKTAIVTGGSSGVGAQCVKELLIMGVSKCVIFDTDVKRGEETMKSIDERYKNNVHFFKCDVTKMGDFENAVKKTKEAYKRIDIFINNAAICDERNWEKMVEVNVNGVMNGTVLGMKYMGKDNGGNGGVIVNMSSVVGLSCSPGFPVYSATQYAIVGMSKSFASPYYYEKTGVRIMAMCLGFTDTELFSKYANNQEKSLLEVQKLEMTRFPVQKKTHVSQAMVTIMIHGHNNSIWVCEGGQEVYEIHSPNRIELKK